MGAPKPEFSLAKIDRSFMMAWEDRMSFDPIENQLDILPGETIKLLRRELKPGSSKRWRERTDGHSTKQGNKFADGHRNVGTRRFRAESQRG